MPPEAKTVGDSIRPKRKFTQTDWEWIADYIREEFQRRKNDRKHLERHWGEIDRQLEMKPDIRRKLDADGNIDARKRWMSEMELPLQSQTLEVLTADSRRMKFPDSGPWFMAHAELSDDYLRRVDFKSLIAGDENEVPSKINQDNADKLAEGWLNHIHRQYDFPAVYDLIDAGGFKYGTGVGRLRAIDKTVYMQTAKGVEKENTVLPILVPQSIKHTYLDDREYVRMSEGMITGPGIIYERTLQLEQVKIAANRGSNDPNSPMGGWMPSMLNKIDADKNGAVHVLEYEGDLVVPRKTVRSLVIPGCIVTVAIGTSDKKSVQRVIRFRFRQTPYSSYLIHPYHQEDESVPYATSPLMKGRPVQAAAVHTLNQLIDSGELKIRPPVSWNRNDPHLVAMGGPWIEPGASWEANGTANQINPHNDIGDPATSFAVYVGLLQQYYDVTGVNQPRLGAQTVSHTTAFAKEAELSRGTIRTVDYVRSSMKGPMTKLLYMEYDLSRRLMKGKHTVYIDAYKGFVEIGKNELPDNVMFEAFGSGGPAEEQQKRQDRLNALQLAMQIDQLKVQLKLGEPMDYGNVQRQVLLDGGWIDVDPFFTEGVSGGDTGAPAIPNGSEGDPGAAAALLQTIGTR